jgi:hypothetical protein
MISYFSLLYMLLKLFMFFPIFLVEILHNVEQFHIASQLFTDSFCYLELSIMEAFTTQKSADIIN